MRFSVLGSFFLGLALVGYSSVATPAAAAPVAFHFDIDTSSLAGQAVHLFFGASGINDGPGSAVGNVATVFDFSTDATLNFPATPFGLTTGDLPGTVKLAFDHENGGVNAKGQYSIDAVFGNSMSFNVLLEGDQLEGTNPTSYAGFEFSVIKDNAYVWLSPNGFVSAEAYQEFGVHKTDAAPQITITPFAIPEPATTALLIASAGALIATRRR